MTQQTKSVPREQCNGFLHGRFLHALGTGCEFRQARGIGNGTWSDPVGADAKL